MRRIAIATDVNYSRVAKVYRDSTWDEYVVKFSVDNTPQTKADYHTDDKEDALNTASAWVNA